LGAILERLEGDIQPTVKTGFVLRVRLVWYEENWEAYCQNRPATMHLEKVKLAAAWDETPTGLCLPTDTESDVIFHAA